MRELRTLVLPRLLVSVVTALAALAVAALTTPATAQDPAAFYGGRTIAILMGTSPGGSYDIYGRVIATHLARHIPGNPNIIIEHMPGAGGALAGNFIYGPGPQDGSKLLLSHALPLMEKLEDGKGIRYESAKLHWLGAYDQIVQVLALWHTAEVRTVDDVKAKSFVLGSMGTSHLSYQWAALLKDVLGANFRVISGYTSGGAINIAMERGEVAGWAVAWENMTSAKPGWLRDKQVTIPLVFALERTKELPNAPTLLELTKGGMRDVVELLAAGTPLARAMAVGPGVPADRVAALRKAFADMMADKAFMEEAAKRNLALNFRSHTAVHALVDKIVGASPELVKRVKQTVGQK